MRPLKQPLSALVLATALLGSAKIAAQPAGSSPVSQSDEERRTKLFKEGKTAADAGQWLEAAEKFRRVVAIRSAPKALIALGVAEEHLGHLVLALAAYKQAREGAADKTLTEELKTANAALEQIRPRVPKLTFTLPDAAAKVEIDGVAVKLEEGTISVDPGDHAITVTSSKGTFRTTATVREAESRAVEVTFDGTTPTATSTSGPDLPPNGASGPPKGALVIGIAGIVAAGVGGALYGIGSGQYDEAAKKCPGTTCSADAVSTGNAARTQMILGDALLGAGAALAAGAAIWWTVSATSKKTDSARSIYVAPQMGGLQLGGRF